MELLGDHRQEGFCYPKFHANRKYPDLIRSKGCVGLASAGYGEGTHKLIKKAWELSNNKSAGLERQVSNNVPQFMLWMAQVTGCITTTPLLYRAKAPVL